MSYQALITALKGGSGSGNFNHAGRLGKIGGSVASKWSQFGDMLNAAPIGKASMSARWRKQQQALYDSDEDFRALVDTVTLYTQGDFRATRALAEYAVTGEIPDDWKESILPQWVNDNFAMSALKNPLSNTKPFFKGQETVNDDDSILHYKSATEAAAILQHTIAASTPSSIPMYRGVPAKGTAVPKVGENIDILGTTSFTASEQVAKDFGAGSAKGNKRDVSRSDHIIMYEVKPGAKGLNASPLSPWDQQEIITSGRFKVTAVEPYETAVYNSRNRKAIPGYRVVLEHDGVWEVDPATFANKPITKGYSHEED